MTETETNVSATDTGMSAIPPLHLAAAKESSRSGISGVQLRTESDGRIAATATNGRILARVYLAPSLVVGLNGSPTVIPAPVVKHVSTGGKKSDVRRIALEGASAIGDRGGSEVRAAILNDRFPPADFVIPTGEPEYRIALNPAMLLDLAKAIGADDPSMFGVVLEFHGADRPVAVRPLCGEGKRAGNVGVIMPISDE